MLSERGKPLIVYKSFKYYQYKQLKTSGEMCWCCIKKECNAKLYTLGETRKPVFSKATGEHKHESISNGVLNRQKVSNGVKRKADEDISVKPAKLIHKEIVEQAETISTLTKRDIKYISNSISRKKLKSVPKLPQSTLDTQDFLDSVVVNTAKEENLLLINNKCNNIVVFGTKSNVKFMCSQDQFYVDGTFDYCPKHFLQLFTIHAYCNEHYVPVLFCLLKNKKKETYKQLFQCVILKCRELGYDWNPKTIVADFEKAIHKAAVETFPHVKIIGCRFHLAQSW